MITGQTSFLQALGWAVLNSLWQMALLWVIYQAITSIARLARSSNKSSLAFILLLFGFGWFVYTFVSALGHSANGAAISSELIVATDPAVNSWIQKALPIASVAYLLLLIVPVSRFIRNYRYVQVIRKYGLSKIDVQWRIFVQKVAAQMGIKKPVHIWVSEFISSPVTIGFLKPVILMPMAAINHLSVQQMESVLLHELSHIRRHDYFINLLINFIQTILYFNPFVKAFVRIVEKEREKSCDETVLQFQYNSYEYATALLTLEKVNNANANQSFLVAAAGHKHDLLNRIEAIVGVQKRKRFAMNKLAGVIASLVCIFAFNFFFIANKSKKNDQPVAATDIVASPAASPVYDAIMSPASSLVRSSGERKTTANSAEPFSFANAAKIIGLNPNYRFVNFAIPQEIPQLTQAQEDQVRSAIDASKKVVENVEWKSMEKNIAEVLTQKEKEQVKKAYRKELNKFDWSIWENKLRIAYNNVDWNTVNDQLSKAVTDIRLDSLRKVYNDAISKLEETSNQLSICELKGIPDTDITIKAIDQKKLEMQQALDRLKSLRTKKIVHL